MFWSPQRITVAVLSILIIAGLAGWFAHISKPAQTLLKPTGDSISKTDSPPASVASTVSTPPAGSGGTTEGPVDPQGGSPNPSKLDVSTAPVRYTISQAKMFAQETDDWCWAASAQSIMATLGVSRDVRQCVQANHQLKNKGIKDCCKDPVQTACIIPAWPDFSFFGFNALVRDSDGLSWDEIKDQIGVKKKPFAFTWDWLKGNAHMLVAIGYYFQDNQRNVVTWNPLPVKKGFQRNITYESYQSDNTSDDGYTHSRDYYDVSLAAPGAAPLIQGGKGLPTDIPPASAPAAQVSHASIGPAYRRRLRVGTSPRVLQSVKENSRTIGGLGGDGATAEEAEVHSTPSQPMDSPPPKKIVIHSRLPIQNAELKGAIANVGAQEAIRAGIRKMAPEAFLNPPPGSSTSVGTATSGVNVGMSELFGNASGGAKPEQPSSRSVATLVKTKLSDAPTELYVPVVGPNSHIGVLTLGRTEGDWRWKAFEEASPLSNAIATKVNVGVTTKPLTSNETLGEIPPPPPGSRAPVNGLRGVVNVRGLNVSFLALVENDKLLLIPLWESPKYGFKSGQAVSAEVAFHTLQTKGSVSNLPR